MSFWLVQNLSEEGFPTGGNDSKGNGDLLDPEAELRGILLIKYSGFPPTGNDVLQAFIYT